MKDYTLRLRKIDAPPIVVPSYTVETYFAISEEQADKLQTRRCIDPELPNAHDVYSKMHDLPETLYESKVHDGLETIWKIRKEKAEEVVQILGIDKSDYPYREALDFIEGDYFWIITWDD